MASRFLRYLWVALFLLVAVGCGSSSSTSSVTNGFALGQEFVVARVDLGGPVAGAKINFRGRDYTTDVNGLAFITPTALGDEYATVTLPATAQGSALTQLSSHVKLLVSERVLPFNIPAHLAFLIRQADTTLTHEQSVARARAVLGIPETWPLGQFEESASSPFVHSVFFNEAANAGGTDALLGQLVTASSQNQTRRFTLSAGLGAGAPETNLFGDVVKSILTGAGSAAGNSTWGWISRLLGLGGGSSSGSAEFAQIQSELQNLENVINSNFQALKSLTAYNTLETEALSIIRADTSTLIDQRATFIPVQPPLALYSFGNQNLVSIFQNRDYIKALTSLNFILTGFDKVVAQPVTDGPNVSNRPERLLAGQIFPKVGIDSNLATYYGYGAFSNVTLRKISSWMDYYLSYAALGSNLLSESAHATIDGVTDGAPSLANALNLLQAECLGSGSGAALAWFRKMVHQMTPPLLDSDQVFVDREYGLMWATVSYGNLTVSQANSVAAGFSAGPYNSGWRMPYAFELQQLYSRIDGGWTNLTSDERKGKKKSAVLEGLGFDLSKMSSTHHVWARAHQGTGPFNISEYRYSLDTGTLSNPFGSHHDLLLVRSYVEDQTGYYISNAELGPADGAEIAIGVQSGAGGQTSLTANLQMDVPIGNPFTINGNPINPVYGDDGLRQINFPVHPISGAAPNSGVSKDITTRVAWSSSSDQSAYVSNVPGEEGKVYWRHPVFNPSSSVTFTAQYLDKKSTVTLQRPDNLVWSVGDILLTPFEGGTLRNAGVDNSVIFVATLLMQNTATGDRMAFRSSEAGGQQGAPEVIWSVEDTQGNPLAATLAEFQTPNKSVLTLHPALPASTIVIVASSGGVVRKTNLTVEN